MLLRSGRCCCGSKCLSRGVCHSGTVLHTHLRFKKLGTTRTTRRRGEINGEIFELKIPKHKEACPAKAVQSNLARQLEAYSVFCNRRPFMLEAL